MKEIREKISQGDILVKVLLKLSVRANEMLRSPNRKQDDYLAEENDRRYAAELRTCTDW